MLGSIIPTFIGEKAGIWRDEVDLSKQRLRSETKPCDAKLSILSRKSVVPSFSTHQNLGGLVKHSWGAPDLK